MTDDSSFAARWSRRKQAVKNEAQEVEEDAVDEVVEEVVEEQPEKSDAEVLAEFDLKDPDEMGAGDDFSGFMNSAIPQRLRNRALRKLWLSNPALANLDELLEYGEDFTNKGGIVEDIVTAYKVGKGFVDKLAEDSEIETESADENPEQDPNRAEESRDIEDSMPVKSVRTPAEKPVKTPPPTVSNVEVIIDTSAVQTKQRRKRVVFKF